MEFLRTRVALAVLSAVLCLQTECNVSSATFSVSGTITPAALGSGATVTLSGGARTATTTANSSGSYTFTGLANGSYTVSPTSSIATFAPTSQNVTVSGSNATVSAFTATATVKVVFYDDFTESALNSQQWWAMSALGHNAIEAQCYVPSEVSLSGGFLVVNAEAKTVTCGNSNATRNYAAGEVDSVFNFTYGTVEYRAKMPGGEGPWSAIWLLGQDCFPVSPVADFDGPNCKWPAPGSDEIDITEIFNSRRTRVNQQVHASGGSPGCKATTTDVTQNFHVYQLIWTPSSLVWTIDGTTTCTVTTLVSNTPKFIIINVALTGARGSINNSTLPQAMQVDYVMVTQP